MNVIEIGTGVAGAYAGRMLALIGADVTRVELRHPAVPPFEGDGLARTYLHQGKRILSPDPAQPDHRERILDLLSGAGALVEDLGPGGLEACGLDEGALRARCPALVLCRISEFGQDGPWSGWAGSGLVNLAAGGLLFLTGSHDRPPVQLAPYQAQLTTGLLAAVATLAALYGGEPATIDISKQEAVAALITPALTEYAYGGTIPAREGTVAAMARIERSRDGWVYAGPGAAANADYQTYARFLGIPEFAEDRFATPEGRMDNWQEHQALLLPKLREQTSREWTDAAAEWRLTFGLTQDTLDLLACDQLAARDFFAPLPDAGEQARAPVAPYLLDGARPTTPTTTGEPHEPATPE